MANQVGLEHVNFMTKTWKAKSWTLYFLSMLYDQNFESSQSWEIQLCDQHMDSQALNDCCLWPKLDKQVMMENPTLR
jgi:hypothetical protein